MLDFHSPILFSEDPTPKNIKETLDIAKAASKAGFKKILATPNFTFHEDFISTYEYDHKKCEYINSYLSENKIDIKLYLGNEISYSSEVVELLENSKIATINKSQYILLKFHEQTCSFYNMIDSVFKLQVAGYIPIISQIEKYDFVMNNHNLVKDLIRRDILVEMNVLSIIGYYGEQVKKTAKELLKHDMIHLLGTNAKTPDLYTKSANALHKINKIVGSAKFIEITTTNGESILNNEVIYPSESKESKKSFLTF